MASPYGSSKPYHLQHVHLFASDIDATIDFYRKWFDAEVIWNGDVAGARNVFIKIGIGAMHLYDPPPRDEGKNAVHHLGIQVVGINELYHRMKAAALHVPNPVRELGEKVDIYARRSGGVVIEVFEPDTKADPIVRRYFGYPEQNGR